MIRVVMSTYAGFALAAGVGFAFIGLLHLGNSDAGITMVSCLGILGAVGMLLGTYWNARHLRIPWWPL